jgi:hypothetical protein
MMKMMLNYNLQNNRLLIVVAIKDINIINKEMVMEFCIFLVVVDMKENGKMIKCMVLVSFITKITLLLTKVIGKMINLTAKAGFITLNL